MELLKEIMMTLQSHVRFCARLIACSDCNPEATRRWLRTEAAKIFGVPSDWQVTNLWQIVF